MVLKAFNPKRRKIAEKKLIRLQETVRHIIHQRREHGFPNEYVILDNLIVSATYEAGELSMRVEDIEEFVEQNT